MKVGDKVICRTRKASVTDQHTIYTVLEIGEDWVKLKHPDISGYFIFSKDTIERVL